ncbi:MAG: hypothetical protein JGK17_15585 [Microcoleus sp. PH2017_10_PVI_O_A]|uniref:hypothetical protein n=1 Tax=unclassified Microcoleus TaxID=2642155 RepID=UPI001DC67419|nr:MULTISPECIES: hypothetical protein [unclassified Microcoleus]TAE81698.1 MAG: hypothetical protein EAZ83_14455 [Oscillatoriales cyanobacterium]MCC3406982.1 hypothetical protein [Microcoleus sp. PH2017_10_PVI_O_A]MCC3461078.1 hypothetical protein [Microcoleus sp. PH2017_11_PCY_U_A]MCC3479595.1 hypothetical protein [Microcoleus sp. PH2017_12_PCY_D_A]MCC3530971.1 hypothetical protein [Microcoleus sp. PH2017_21_RUC_O_A]
MAIHEGEFDAVFLPKQKFNRFHKNSNHAKNIFWRLTLLVILQLAISLLGEKAQAGGGDPVDLDSETRPKSINATANIKWDKWSQPYWFNSQICREKSGEIACFSSDTAKKMGWNIPERN